ncbi:MAG: YciI family protein [Legionellaceae bacterium]|nr:YciI family protein [Legionellaceae bacterium]
MFIIQVSYLVPVAEIDKFLQAHREYLDYHYKQGVLVASGPLNPRLGGIIIAATKSRAWVDTFIQEDPFYKAEVASYTVQEFTPIKHCEALHALIQETEGNLC